MIYQNILITNLEDGVTTFMMTLDLYVVKEIPVPATFGIGLFKSKQTGDMITLEQYLRYHTRN